MIGGMDSLRRKQIKLAVASGTIAAVLGTAAAFAFSNYSDVTLRIIGAITGACLIALVVDTINRRNDPRYAKRPPDAP